MDILILGGGGREHALTWKLRRSSKVRKIFVSPGNAGTETIAENVLLDLADHRAIVSFAKINDIGLAVIGPDDLLARGVADSLQVARVPVFGPMRAAAEIEWSKAFAKQFMREEGIPTARFAVFSDVNEAKKYLGQQSLPIVIKAKIG